MAGAIFISYRRDDSRHAAGRLVDRLAQTFHRDQLFMDVDTIEPGLDFVEVVSERVAACDVLLAIIGPGWISARDERGERRLENPDDFVRIEIEAALKRNVRVVPVLVDGAAMPKAAELPEPLQPLVRRNAVRLAHERFGAEAEDLANSLAKVVPPKGSGGGGPSTATTGAARHTSPAIRMGSPSSTTAVSMLGLAAPTSKTFYIGLFVLPLAIVGSAFVGAWTWMGLGLPHLWGHEAANTGATIFSGTAFIAGANWLSRGLADRGPIGKLSYILVMVAGFGMIGFFSVVR